MTKSKVIYKSSYYTACAMHDGSLIVTKNRTQKGRQLMGEQALVWIYALKTASDMAEANALCHAILKG